MESLLAHVARKERHRLRVHQVDIDKRRDLAEKLHVESAPTIVLVKDRRVVARVVGRASAPQIEALVEQHLADVATPA
jgi:thioredoxin-like negative regulator of GroEL